MAVPWINFLAPSMGGIGPIELADFSKLQTLQERNGVPFYAGRFYPKDSQAIIEDLSIGLISETPPWLMWEEIKPTQIWMVPAFEDERIVSTMTSIERIDVWPREEDDPGEIPDFDTESERHLTVENNYWGDASLSLTVYAPNNTIDPGITVTQNVLPPILVAGYVGISQISGRVSEYGFYDSEVHIVNHKDYGQRHLPTDEYEMIRIREDGAWIRRDAELPKNDEGQLVFVDDNEDGYPKDNAWSREEYDGSGLYSLFVHSDYEEAGLFGHEYTNVLTSWTDQETPRPRAGLVSFLPSKMDTIVLTIKVSCVTINVPDPVPGETQLTLDDYARSGLETFGSNLTNNIWYFYWPVRYNGDLPSQRFDNLLARAGINKLSNEFYRPPG
jgi:hypothetical protein